MGDPGAAIITRFVGLGATIGIGMVTYLAAVVLMRAPELTELRQMRAQKST